MPLFYHGSRQDRVLLGFSVIATLSILGLSVLGFVPVGEITHRLGMGLVCGAGLGCSVFYPSVITLLGRVFAQSQSQAIAFAATGGAFFLLNATAVTAASERSIWVPGSSFEIE